MNITINKDTSIEQLIQYLKVNRHNLNDVIANSLRSNFKTIGDIYNVSYQELSTLTKITDKYIFHLATIFIINDYEFCNDTPLYSSIRNKNIDQKFISKWEHYDKFIKWYKEFYTEILEKEPQCPSFRFLSMFIYGLTRQSKEEKASRLFQQLLEIWNDDVEQQVEDIINQSR